MKSVTFDYNKLAAWGVKIHAPGQGRQRAQLVAIALDGTLENLGAYVRHFHGTWTQGGRQGRVRGDEELERALDSGLGVGSRLLEGL